MRKKRKKGKTNNSSNARKSAMRYMFLQVVAARDPIRSNVFILRKGETQTNCLQLNNRTVVGYKYRGAQPSPCRPIRDQESKPRTRIEGGGEEIGEKRHSFSFNTGPEG